MHSSGKLGWDLCPLVKQESKSRSQGVEKKEKEDNRRQMHSHKLVTETTLRMLNFFTRIVLLKYLRAFCALAH